MKTVLRVAGTITIFLFGFFAINYCIFYVIATLFNIKPGLIFYTLLIIAVVSYPLSTLGGRIVSNRYIRIFYIIASSWMGISFYLLTFI
ncbi:MAG: hypothetical protein PHY59_01635 [Methanobacterium sp.]|nr:hypothetical protein [Methanobacterium sp.]